MPAPPAPPPDTGSGTATPHLSLTGVDARYGATRVVRDLSLEAFRGETIAILGPSGSGKTTALRMIAGLHPVAAGTIEVDGRRVERLPAQKRGIGLVPQQGALFPHLSVADNIGFGLVPANPVQRWQSRSARRRRVAEMLDLVDLGGRGDDRPSELSGGQQQRVALARALAPGCDLVLLDEPFSALDAELRERVRREVKELLERAGVTSVLVTHEQSEALSLADRVAVLIDGRVVQFGDADEVYRTPASVQSAKLTGPTLALRADADGPVARTPVGTVELDSPATGQGAVTVRPEDVRVTAAGEHEGCAVCAGMSFAGPSTTIHLVLDDAPDAERSLDIAVSEAGGLRTGDRVSVTLTRPAVFHPHVTGSDVPENDAAVDTTSGN